MNADTAGLGLVQAAGGELDVNVDDSTIEINTDTVRVKAAGITTNEMAANSVDSASYVDGSIDPEHMAAANAGEGLSHAAGTGFAVNVDDSSIEISADTLQVKAGGIVNAMMASNSVDSDQYIDGSVDEIHLSTALAAKINAAGDATIEAAADAALAQGEIVFLDEADGDRATKAVASSASGFEGKLYVVQEAVATRDDVVTLVSGVSVLDYIAGIGGFSFDTTKPLYLSESEAGKVTHTAPSTVGQIVQLLGYASDTADEWTFRARHIATL